MVLLAKKTPGGAAGFRWVEPNAVVDVPENIVSDLLRLGAEDYYVAPEEEKAARGRPRKKVEPQSEDRPLGYVPSHVKPKPNVSTATPLNWEDQAEAPVSTAIGTLKTKK